MCPCCFVVFVVRIACYVCGVVCSCVFCWFSLSYDVCLVCCGWFVLCCCMCLCVALRCAHVVLFVVCVCDCSVCYVWSGWLFSVHVTLVWLGCCCVCDVVVVDVACFVLVCCLLCVMLCVCVRVFD